MVRSFFLALGIFVIVLGLESLAVDTVEWRGKPPVPKTGYSAPTVSDKVFHVPDWAPWSCLSGGAVTVLYAIALPKRLGAG
ncbi:MAG TPA: hypothetical protein VGE52_18925 [Pirellulales bacterium]